MKFSSNLSQIVRRDVAGEAFAMPLGPLTEGRDFVFCDNLKPEFRSRLRSDCHRLRNGRLREGVIYEVCVVAVYVGTQTRHRILRCVASSLRLARENVNGETVVLRNYQHRIIAVVTLDASQVLRSTDPSSN